MQKFSANVGFGAIFCFITEKPSVILSVLAFFVLKYEFFSNNYLNFDAKSKYFQNLQ